MHKCQCVPTPSSLDKSSGAGQGKLKSLGPQDRMRRYCNDLSAEEWVQEEKCAWPDSVGQGTFPVLITSF